VVMLSAQLLVLALLRVPFHHHRHAEPPSVDSCFDVHGDFDLSVLERPAGRDLPKAVSRRLVAAAAVAVAPGEPEMDS